MTPGEKKQQLIRSATRLLQQLSRKSASDLSDISLLAAGSYGVVYSMPASCPLLSYLNHATGFKIQNKDDQRTNDLLTRAAAREDELVLKLSKVREMPMSNGRPVYDYFNGFVRENVIHISLSHKKFLGVHGSDIVPQFYFSGAITSRSEGMWYVTVMGKAQAHTLKALVNSRPDKALSAMEYVQIERAIMQLWLLGVVHADLHMSNVMFDPQTMKVTILDFGFAVPLPERIIRILRSHKALLEDVNGDEIYSGVHDYVTKTVQRRIAGIQHFNADGDLLQRLRGMVRDPDNIPLARAEEGVITTSSRATGAKKN